MTAIIIFSVLAAAVILVAISTRGIRNTYNSGVEPPVVDYDNDAHYSWLINQDMADHIHNGRNR